MTQLERLQAIAAARKFANEVRSNPTQAFKVADSVIDALSDEQVAVFIDQLAHRFRLTQRKDYLWEVQS